MTVQTIIEMTGYLGSLLVIVSMLMTSVVKLRIINTIGSVIFCGYALCIHSYPTAIMQAVLIAINIFGLYKLMNTKKDFSVVQVSAADGFFVHFLDRNADDIRNFFPDFAVSDDDTFFLITCGDIPAGVFVAQKEGTALRVKLDYTTPAYRDTSVGRFLYNYLKTEGVQKICTKTEIPAHEKYLKKMGFSQDGDSFEKRF